VFLSRFFEMKEKTNAQTDDGQFCPTAAGAHVREILF
jgi:hypothetical protein